MQKLYTIVSSLKLGVLFFLISFFVPTSFGDSYFDAGQSSIRLISESYQIDAEDTLLVGLEIKLNSSWHTYWKNPGDSGEGATIKWDLPEGFEASNILWPGPERIPVDPLMTYGYEDQVILLTKIKSPQDFSDTLTISAKVTWLTCKEICIPQEGKVDLILSKGPKEKSKFYKKLNDVSTSLPIPSLQSSRVVVINNKIFLQFEDLRPKDLSEVYFFPNDYGVISYVKEQKLEKNNKSLSLELSPAEIQIETNKLRGVLKIKTPTKEEFYEVDLPLGNGAKSSELSMSLLTGIFFAFLGGIILNAMPCVFPILSIKILGFIEQSRGSRRKLLHHGLIFSAGVLTTFLIISSLLISLRASGEAIGWGYQLQSPWVVSTLIYLFVAIGIIFMGNIVLGSRLASIGVLGQGRKDLMSSFFTGVLAVIVASPCTAPFMGPALGLALLQPGFKSIAIFLALGIGFSIPYLLLSIFPQFLSKLPKPGEWMQTLKQIMAFPMWASALWLAWVLSAQVEIQTVFEVLIGALLIALTFWMLDKTQGSSIPVKRLTLALSLGLISVSFWLLPLNASEQTFKPMEATNSFSLEKLNSLRIEERPVFVNFTADWCITCKVNEAIALDQQEVKDLINKKGIVYLKADWTRKDSEIANILAEYGRTGVPLYLLFPSKGDPIILPELLTEETLLAFLNEIN
tara:strand:- start:3194 stop:5251 length:2058 start_codon:yes stop_codon:yes gene_type:complete